MKAILTGYGEIGHAVHDLFSKTHEIKIHDPVKSLFFIASGYADGLLVAFPYDESFVNRVKMYAKKHQVKFVIIFSTVPIGTTKQIENAVHCPVEGRHPELSKSMSLWKWFIGGRNEMAELFFNQAFVKPVVYEDSRWTEFAKLASTLNYGLNIEWARYCGKISEKIDMPYSVIHEYTKAYNSLYEKLNKPEIKRYILYPPTGRIGGHCVLENAEILNETFPNALIEYMLNINREKE